MKRSSDIVAKVFGYLGAAFLAAMMLLTVTDVVLRATIKFPIRGTFELIELGLAYTIFIALPAVFLRGGHLVVDVIDHFVSPRAKHWLDFAGVLISLVILLVMVWRMVPLAYDMYRFGDVTSDLSIAKIWYWIPVLLGTSASALVMLVFAVTWWRRK